uniref:Uncharacterized protein n=1 Tax=viral metagenome TaxID=1070528 RepID=A0A6M3LE77_9ZZZZ
MLKEQVAEILNDIPCKRYKCDFWDVQGNYCYANSADKNASYDCPMAEAILNIFKAEVDKLTVIDDEEIMSHAKDEVQHTFGWTREVILSGARVVAQAQLQDTKK